jgi:phosphoglycerate dehydrogenase-like enzyme
MTRIAVLDDYQRVALDMADWDRLGADCRIDVFDRNLAVVDEAAEVLSPYEVICLMRERMPVPRALIERLPGLKLLVTTGGHNRTIDMEAAAAHGVTVCHTGPGESAHATPELAWALILAAVRHLPEEHRRMREGGWQETIGTMLHGTTLGLLGLGRMGVRMVPVARAFGMDVIAWSPNLTAERAAEAGAALVSKDELFARSDVVSIHLVLGDRSRGLVGAAELARMKPTAILVNTSRGPVVDEAAMIEALQSRRIRAAALDVYDVEPLPADHPLRRIDNVVLAPHLGYVTEGAYREFYTHIVENIEAWRAGAPVRVLAAPK